MQTDADRCRGFFLADRCRGFGDPAWMGGAFWVGLHDPGGLRQVPLALELLAGPDGVPSRIGREE